MKSGTIVRIENDLFPKAQGTLGVVVNAAPVIDNDKTYDMVLLINLF